MPVILTLGHRDEDCKFHDYRERTCHKAINKIKQDETKGHSRKKNNVLETIVIDFGHSSLIAKPELFVVLLTFFYRDNLFIRCSFSLGVLGTKNRVLHIVGKWSSPLSYICIPSYVESNSLSNLSCFFRSFCLSMEFYSSYFVLQ